MPPVEPIATTLPSPVYVYDTFLSDDSFEAAVRVCSSLADTDFTDVPACASLLTSLLDTVCAHPSNDALMSAVLSAVGCMAARGLGIVQGALLCVPDMPGAIVASTARGPALRLQACILLSHLIDSDTSDVFVAAGAVNAVLAVLQGGVSAPDLAASALLALAALSQVETVFASLPDRNAWLAAVLPGMDALVEDVNVQHVGCKCIVNVCWPVAAVPAFLDIEACLARLCAAADAHIQSCDVQEAVCFAFSNLCALDAAYVPALLAPGLPRVLRAMSSHADVSDVLVQAFLAVQGMCGASCEVQGWVVEEGVLPCVYCGMDAHVGCAAVAAAGCAVLASIVCGVPGLQECVLGSGGLRRVLAAMDTHTHEAQVQAHGARALLALSGTRDTTAAVVQADSVRRLFVGMAAHITAPDVQTHVCAALARVAADATGKQAIRTPKHMALLADVKTRHPCCADTVSSILSIVDL